MQTGGERNLSYLHGHSSREGLFLERGGGNLFFACADWLTGACIIPYKCKYFSFHSPVTVLFLPQSSPFLHPFSSHLPPSLSRSSLSLSTFLLFLLFGY